MSGHSKWSKIKHQKATGDAKKGQIFSKLSKLITVAVRKGKDPESNIELKHAINQAKTASMPAGNIERAIKKGSGELQGELLEEVQYEAFGPGGTAILMKGVTDNKNRTSNEIKHLLAQHSAKLAQLGATTWLIKNPIEISDTDKENLEKLIKALKNHDDIQSIHTNTRN
ncbi:YebC/PmpR family DNA-binding transcriptional regulator [Patescibacteria group bacterium]